MISIANTIESGHEEDIVDVKVDYYGLMMATGSSDGEIKIFNVKSQELIANLKGHYGLVSQLSWAHPQFGSILASCSFDKRIVIWKDERGWMKMNEFTLSSPATCIEFAPFNSGLMLACGNTDGKVNIITFENGTWDIKTLRAHVMSCTSLSWEPTFNGQSYLVTGGLDDYIRIWTKDLSGWQEIEKIDAHLDWVLDVAWAPSSTVNMIASCSTDKSVIIYTSTDKKNWSYKVLQTFPDVVSGISWGQNLLAVTTVRKKVYLWKENTLGQWVCVSESDIQGVEPNSNFQFT